MGNSHSPPAWSLPLVYKFFTATGALLKMKISISREYYVFDSLLTLKLTLYFLLFSIPLTLCAMPYAIFQAVVRQRQSVINQNSTGPGSQFISPLKNRVSSDWRILQPFPALIALILPRRIYLRNVGLEIFKYSMASSVVNTVSKSLSINDIELPPFVLNFFYLSKKHAYIIFQD